MVSGLFSAKGESCYSLLLPIPLHTTIFHRLSPFLSLVLAGHLLTLHDMLSQTPLYVPANSTLVVNMWRQTDGRKVWYEWLVESFLDIGNDAKGTGSKGQRIRLGSSELHSSVGNACLM